MISKKYLLFESGVITAGLVIVGIFGTYSLCNNNENCINILHFFFINFLPIFGVFLFSLITFKMREEVYRAWFRFARWYVPIAMLLILITPEYGGGLFNPIQKGSVAFVLTALFFVISLVIVAIKYFRVR